MIGHRWIAASLIAAACITSGCVFGQGKFKLEFSTVEANHPIARQYAHRARSLPGKPEQIKKEPENLSENATYLTFALMGEELHLIIDGNSEKATLWADTDFDGDLAEEKAIEGKIGDAWPPIDFGRVELNVPGKEGSTKRMIGVGANVWGKNAQAYFCPRSVQAGEMKVDGKKVRVEIADTNLDGAYDGFVRPDFLGGADYVSFTVLAEDGALAGRSSGEPLTKIAKIDGTYYELNPSSDGSSIEIKNVDIKYGTLDVGCPIMEMSLSGTVGAIALRPNKEGKWELPVGTYGPNLIRLVEKDAEGNEKRIQWDYRGGKLSRFEIKEGETTSIPAGTPLVIGSEVGATGDSLTIGLLVYGRAGEGYQANLEQSGSPRSAPTFKVVDRDGNLLTKGQFQYG